MGKMINVRVRDDDTHKEYLKLTKKMSALGYNLSVFIPQILLEAMRRFIREHKNGKKV